MADKEHTNPERMEKIVSLCKRRGFIYQSAELYGGLNGCWDYGPMGVEIKRNLKNYWWRKNVRERDDIVGLDGSILTHQAILTASGHVGGFSDPMIDCRTCKARFRADNLDGVECPRKPSRRPGHGPECDLTEAREFNLMFQTTVGASAEEDDPNAVAYLRPETAQSIFTQFKNVLETSRQKLPFGIAQIGKAFRNEINPRNYTFRSREFEQMELEFFVKPGSDAHWHAYWVDERMKWYEAIGLPRDALDRYVYGDEELAHYASACVDILYDFPFGMQELEGIAARGDFDLRSHQECSGKSMAYFDPEAKEKYVPHVIEPSAGVDRIALALICEAYREEWVPGQAPGDPSAETAPRPILEARPGENPPEGYDARTVMRFHPSVAPVKVAVFPLLKNKSELVRKGRAVFEPLRERWACVWDQVGAIGRRYRRQDEIGTPFCVTIDFQTLEDDTVTLRNRDSMQQERLQVGALPARLQDVLP